MVFANFNTKQGFFIGNNIFYLIYVDEFGNMNKMIALNIVLGIIFFILYVSMMTTMIILERDKPKNMIIWSVVFLFTQVVGYVIYLSIRHVFYKKRNSFATKLKEDEIYDKLISNKLNNNVATCNHEVFEFNSLAFNTHTTLNNNYEIIHDYKALKENLIEDLNKAKNYIILELTKVNAKDFEGIKNVLIEKAKENIVVKFVYDRMLNHKLIKELKHAGVRVYRFCRHNTVEKVYANLRNAITIDGEVVYVANLNVSNRQLKTTKEIAQTYLKLKGDIVQDIDVLTHKDAIFASGKFIPYELHNNPNYNNNNQIQLVTNNVETNLELALIKAICMSKKSIQLQLSEFIPTESIKSLLRFAINSNIQVRLMVPLKNDRQGNYFASRAYAKELALFGANVYLFDGYINFNAITIDDEYVIFGSFIVDREHLNTSPQSMLFIKDNKAIKNFNEMFNNGINNSYRINNARFMLLREKFFKNFV